MPARARNLAPVVVVTTPNILSTSDGFEMCRIHTRSVATQMIDVKPWSYRTIEAFVDPAVGVILPPTSSDPSVTLRVQIAFPGPALAGPVDEAPESVLCAHADAY